METEYKTARYNTTFNPKGDLENHHIMILASRESTMVQEVAEFITEQLCDNFEDTKAKCKTKNEELEMLKKEIFYYFDITNDTHLIPESNYWKIENDRSLSISIEGVSSLQEKGNGRFEDRLVYCIFDCIFI